MAWKLRPAMTIKVVLPALASLVVVLPPTFAATIEYSTTNLTSDSPERGAGLGGAVLIADDGLVAGAPSRGPGALHIFTPGAGGELVESRYSPPGLATDAEFGSSIALADGRLVVGAPRDDNSPLPPPDGEDEPRPRPGAVYVLTPDGVGGYSHQKLLASDGADSDGFGWAVTTDGAALVIGAVVNSTLNSGSGAAYRFEPDGEGGYVETHKFSPEGLGDSALFGSALAAAEGTIFVSAPQDSFFDDSRGEVPAGRVYIFEPDGDGGYIESSIDSPVVCEFSGFGQALDASATHLLVGSPGGCNYFSGSAQLFERSPDQSYSPVGRFWVSDLDAFDSFGASVALDGAVVYATAASQYDDSLGESFPSVTRFDPDGVGGFLQTTIRPDGLREDDRFGSSMSVAGGTIIVGASGHTQGPGLDGAGLVSIITPVDVVAPTVTGVVTPTPNAAGWLDQPATITWSAVDPDPSSGLRDPLPPDTAATAEGIMVYTSAEVCDMAGNCATGSVEVSIDLTDPELELNAPADGSTIPEDEYVEPTCIASDTPSGLAENCVLEVVEVSSNPSGRVLTATAVATDRAGRRVERSSTYTVGQDEPGPTCEGLPATIVGTEGNDRLFGTPGNDVIVALGGNDRVQGGGGDDTICLGEGRDTANGGDGADRILGGPGRDAISGGRGDDDLDGGAENDRIFGQDGIDVVSGGDGNDTINGGRGDDDLNGDAGRDRVIGGSGNDGIAGGDDNDRLFGQNGDDAIDGGLGYDVANGGRGTDQCIGEVMTSCEA